MIDLETIISIVNVIVWPIVIGINYWNIRTYLRNSKGSRCKWLKHKPLVVGYKTLSGEYFSVFYKCTRCNMMGSDPVTKLNSKKWIRWGRNINWFNSQMRLNASTRDNVRVWRLHEKKLSR